MVFQRAKHLKGEVTVPGDKSISHRAVMFGSLAKGTTEVTNFLQGADCLSTIDCFRKMGIKIDNTPERILIHGNGLHGLSAPTDILDVGNSGTTARLISGILAAQSFESALTGDASIKKRPMRRIMTVHLCASWAHLCTAYIITLKWPRHKSSHPCFWQACMQTALHR